MVHEEEERGTTMESTETERKNEGKELRKVNGKKDGGQGIRGKRESGEKRREVRVVKVHIRPYRRGDCLMRMYRVLGTLFFKESAL